MRRNVAMSRPALGAAACLSIGTASAKTFNLTFAAPQGEHMTWIALTRTVFIAGVDKRLEGTEHKINWTTAYGGTLSKVGGTLEVIEEGIADAGMLYSLFEQAKLPLQNVAYMAPFGSDDLGLALRVFQELHDELPEMSGSWEKHGQVFIAPIGFDTFYPLTKFPIKSLRTSGAASWRAPGRCRSGRRRSASCPCRATSRSISTISRPGSMTG